jgi:hypothetical protein
MNDRKGRLNVPQTVQGTILTSLWIFQQAAFSHEGPERLIEILGHGSVRQSKDRLI